MSNRRMRLELYMDTSQWLLKFADSNISAGRGQKVKVGDGNDATHKDKDKHSLSLTHTQMEL